MPKITAQEAQDIKQLMRAALLARACAAVNRGHVSQEQTDIQYLESAKAEIRLEEYVDMLAGRL